MSQRRADANDAIVGHNIRAHLLMKKMSQSALAGEIGITFQQVQIREGVNRVGSGRLVRIATVLDVPVMTLFAGVPGARRVPCPVRRRADRERAATAARPGVRRNRRQVPAPLADVARRRNRAARAEPPRGRTAIGIGNFPNVTYAARYDTTGTRFPCWGVSWPVNHSKLLGTARTIRRSANVPFALSRWSTWRCCRAR